MSAWTYSVDSITQGLVTTVDISAKRKCGRVELLTAYLFPAGWRMSDSSVPASVRREALRFAREVWPDE